MRQLDRPDRRRKRVIALGKDAEAMLTLNPARAPARSPHLGHGCAELNWTGELVRATGRLAKHGESSIVGGLKLRNFSIPNPGRVLIRDTVFEERLRYRTYRDAVARDPQRSAGRLEDNLGLEQPIVRFRRPVSDSRLVQIVECARIYRTALNAPQRVWHQF